MQNLRAIVILGGIGGSLLVALLLPLAHAFADFSHPAEGLLPGGFLAWIGGLHG